MPMPEAAVNQNDLPVLGQDHVWAAGKILAVQAEAISETVEH